MSEGAASEESGAVSLGPRNTERFVLRRFAESDAPLLAAMNIDPEVMRYIRPPDTDPDEALERARHHCAAAGQLRFVGDRRQADRRVSRLGRAKRSRREPRNRSRVRTTA